MSDAFKASAHSESSSKSVNSGMDACAKLSAPATLTCPDQLLQPPELGKRFLEAVSDLHNAQSSRLHRITCESGRSNRTHMLNYTMRSD
jgi:hypothetical protein